MLTVIIDTDCGVDDALALTAALSSEAVEVAAITCVAGNTTLDNVTLNVSKVLHVCHRDEVPFYRGCERALCRVTNFPTDYFGEDGLGNCPAEFVTGPEPQKGHAADAIVEICKKRPGEITLVLIGPGSNLALAQRLDPDVTSYLKQIICIGGNLKGVGNITAGAEFNFAWDPESASIVLQESKCPVVLIPLEAITGNRIPWSLYKEFTSEPSLKSRFLGAICKFTEKYYKENEGFMLGDFLAVLAALSPQAVTGKTELRLAVELKGEYTSGQVVQGWDDSILPDVKKVTTVVNEFDPELVKSYVLSMVEGPNN